MCGGAKWWQTVLVVRRGAREEKGETKKQGKIKK